METFHTMLSQRGQLLLIYEKYKFRKYRVLKTSRKRSLLWKYFEVVDDLYSIAKCKICGHHMSYRSSTSNLKKHMARKHPKYCKTTDSNSGKKESKKRSVLWRYFEIVDHFTSRAKCNICGHELSYRSTTSNLKRHMIKKHPKNKIQPQCFAILGKRKSSYLWKYFERIDDWQCKAKCLICGHDISYRSTTNNLKKHLNRKHPVDRRTMRPYFDIMDHIEGKALCKLCLRKISYKSTTSNLKKHFERKHNFLKLSKETVQAKCKLCSHQLSYRSTTSNLRSRKRSSLWKYFEILDDLLSKARCRLCDHELSYRTSTSNLKKHLLSKHPTTERITSRRTSRLWNHFQIVDGLRGKAECNICGQELSYKTTNTNLKKHLMNKHPTGQPLSMKEKRPKKRTSRMWNYFDITDRIEGKAKCKICRLPFSFKSTITNLKMHLIRAHPDNLDYELEKTPGEETPTPGKEDWHHQINKTVWKCCHYFRSKENRCKSTLVTTGRIVTVSRDIHNHPPVPKKDKYKNMLSQSTIYFELGTRNPKIVLDDHVYLIKKKDTKRTVWKCSYYFRCKENRCKSTLVTTGRVVNVSSDIHNHPPVPRKGNSKNMLSQAVTIVRENNLLRRRNQEPEDCIR
nr:unnamed protein product [Callosobruchus analis]